MYVEARMQTSRPIIGNVLILSLLCTAELVQASCSSGGEEPIPGQQAAAPLAQAQAQEPPANLAVALPPDASTRVDAGQAIAASDVQEAKPSSGVHFLLGDWSGSLSERRVQGALRQVHRRLRACANKHDGYGTYEISYRLNASFEARNPPKRVGWVHPIEIRAMQASSEQAVQCIKYALRQQNHYMRKYKEARVSGTLSIIE